MGSVGAGVAVRDRHALVYVCAGSGFCRRPGKIHPRGGFLAHHLSLYSVHFPGLTSGRGAQHPGPFRGHGGDSDSAQSVSDHCLGGVCTGCGHAGPRLGMGRGRRRRGAAGLVDGGVEEGGGGAAPSTAPADNGNPASADAVFPRGPGRWRLSGQSGDRCDHRLAAAHGVHFLPLLC